MIVNPPQTSQKFEEEKKIKTTPMLTMLMLPD
jgi:hypothetical protein